MAVCPFILFECCFPLYKLLSLWGGRIERQKSLVGLLLLSSTCCGEGLSVVTHRVYGHPKKAEQCNEIIEMVNTVIFH